MRSWENSILVRAHVEAGILHLYLELLVLQRAAGKLLDLDPMKLQMAFGIAASEASRIGANIGTMTKPFHSCQG